MLTIAFKDLETKIKNHDGLLAKAAIAENKLECFSSSNNFRIVGIPFQPWEDCIAVPREFLARHF